MLSFTKTNNAAHEEYVAGFDRGIYRIAKQPDGRWHAAFYRNSDIFALDDMIHPTLEAAKAECEEDARIRSLRSSTRDG